MNSFFLLVLVIVHSVVALIGTVRCVERHLNGYEIHGLPYRGMSSWQEQALVTVTNIARMTPNGFSKLVNSEVSISTRVRPLYSHFKLSQVARFHSTDMATSDCFQHKSCDGTDVLSRMQRFYVDGSLLENVA
jgi:hypothetical protein